MVITPVVDGQPHFVAVTDMGPLDLSSLESFEPNQGKLDDYLRKYVNDGLFDIPKLINDDYFEAIKLLYNNQKYVSALKLIMSLIDTMAFIEYGDAPKNFTSWLNAYADLENIGVTSDEIWELRNVLLHTTSLESRKVRTGQVPRLVPILGSLPDTIDLDDDSHKHFRLFLLVRCTTNAVGSWIATFESNPTKFSDFVARYDMVISDARYATLRFDEKS